MILFLLYDPNIFNKHLWCLVTVSNIFVPFYITEDTVAMVTKMTKTYSLTIGLQAPTKNNTENSGNRPVVSYLN